MTVSRYCSLSKSTTPVVALLVSAFGAYGQGNDEPAQLVAPRPVYRVLDAPGASFSYVLNAPPDDPPFLEIHDSTGALVASIRSDTMLPGLNRVEWDLRWEPPMQVALRTTPPENPHIWEEERYHGKDTRPVGHKGLEQTQFGPIAAPGHYTLELHVDAKTYRQPFDILLPPNSHGTDADVQASVRLQLRLRDDIRSVATMVNDIERMRKQIEDQRKKAPGPALEEMDGKLKAVEFKLLSPADMIGDDKNDAIGARLYVNFLWLNLSLSTGTGKNAGGGDYAPTDTQLSLTADLEKELHAVEAEYKKLLDDPGLSAFRRVK